MSAATAWAGDAGRVGWRLAFWRAAWPRVALGRHAFFRRTCFPHISLNQPVRRWAILLATVLAASGPLQAQQPGSPAAASGLTASAPATASGLAASAPAAGPTTAAAPTESALAVSAAAESPPAAPAPAEGPPARPAPAEAKAPAVAAVTQPPRGFGHVLGDVFTQRVLLQHQGRALEPSALPPAERVGLWLERRDVRRETDAEGRPWLAIDYQVINAPRAITVITLPGFTLPTREGVALAVAPGRLSVGPLLGVTAGPVVDPIVDASADPPSSSSPAATAPGASSLLRPDREVAPTATRPIERRLAQSLGALAAVLAAWAAWWGWRQWRESHRLPFARAWRSLRRADAAEGRDPAAWLAVHQALNETAGRVVHAATLPRLLEEAPHLQPLAEPLRAFFRASAARFFGADGAAPAFPLHELGRSLRDAERRQQR